MNANIQIAEPVRKIVAKFPLMDRFHEIPDAAAILCNKAGVYRQAKIFRRADEVYAGYGVGFIRLFRDGGTSSPHLRHVGLDLAGLSTTEDKLGRLFIEADHA